MNLKRALKLIKDNTVALRQDHKVEALFIFGSLARGEDSAKSDIDLLVRFSSNEVSLFDFVRLKLFLEKILDRRVDLVTSDALKEPMKGEIERDAVRAA